MQKAYVSAHPHTKEAPTLHTHASKHYKNTHQNDPNRQEVVIKQTREKNREKEKRHFTSNQRCRGEETEREREGEVEVERERHAKGETLLLISPDPKFRQAHTEARAVPVGLGPWHCGCVCERKSVGLCVSAQCVRPTRLISHE